jgi:hypothetical protein
MSLVKVLAYRIGEKPAMIEIENGLKASQEFVGGYIEEVRLASNISVICNEDGNLKPLPINAAVKTIHGPYVSIRGNFFVVGVTQEGEFCDLTEEEINGVRATTFQIMEERI